MHAQAARTRRYRPIFTTVNRYETPMLLTIVNMFKLVYFQNQKCDCIKSTLLEAIAIAYGFNPEGGTRNYSFSTYDSHSELCNAIRLSISDTQPAELPDLDQILLIYCRSGNRSKQAAQKLADMGYTNIYEFGGINTWTGEIVTGETENAKTVTEEETRGSESSGTETRSEDSVSLKFDSFDGGGHEYTVEIEDPSVIDYTSKRDYGSANYQEEDGSPFAMIFIFTGIKPGKTTISIYGRSPIMENEDSFYEAVVDEKLNVTLTPVQRISTLDLYRNADIYYPSYKIWMDTEGYVLSIDEEEEYPVSSETMDAFPTSLCFGSWYLAIQSL